MTREQPSLAHLRLCAARRYALRHVALAVALEDPEEWERWARAWGAR